MATSTLGNGTLVLAGTTSGTTTLQATAVAGTTTLTLPAATDTLVGKATTDTLTNKTLTGAVMNGTVGATTPSTGAFTTLTSTGASSFATSSGDVGIGTSSPTSRLHVSNSTASTNAIAQFTNGTTGTGAGNGLYVGVDTSNEATVFNFYNSALKFGTNAAERMRLDSSGNLLVARTNATFYGGAVKLGVEQTSGAAWGFGVNANGNAIVFNHTANTSSGVGSITVTTSATAFNTSSDYRLKNTITPMTGALAKVAALKPVVYKWNFDGSDGEGFIAHELAEVCPHAVTGEKDAVDEEGTPRYQGVDTSFLVATLTAAIQEQQALITQLQADVAALKGA